MRLTSIAVILGCLLAWLSPRPAFSQIEIEPAALKVMLNQLRQQTNAWIANAPTDDNAQLDNMLQLLKDRDGDALVSDRTDLLFEIADKKTAYQAELAQIYLKNGLVNRGLAILVATNAQQPDAANLDRALYMIPKNNLQPEQLRSIQEIYDQLLSKNIVVDDYSIVRLAILNYLLGKTDPNKAVLANNMLASLPKGSAYQSWGQYVRASQLVRQDKSVEARPLFQELCNKNDVNLNVKYSACLAFGRLAAADKMFPEALEAFNALPADSALFQPAAYESVWSSWQGKQFDQALENSETWQKLFNFNDTSYEVERLRALSLLETKRFAEALENYSDIKTLMKIEAANINLVHNNFQGAYREFLIGFNNASLTFPLTPRMRRYFNNNRDFQALLSLQNSLDQLDNLNDNLRNRLSRLNSYLQQSELLMDPATLNRLDRGMTLYNVANNFRLLLTQLRQNTPSFGVEKDGYELAANETLREIASQLNILSTVGTHFQNSGNFFIGSKRSIFANLVNQTNELQNRLVQRQKNLNKLLADYQGIAWVPGNKAILEHASTAAKNLVTISPQEVPPSITDVAEETQKLIDSLAIELRKWTQPALLNRQTYVKQAVNIQKSLDAKNRTRENLAKQLDKLANQIIPDLLTKYKNALDSLRTDIEWGMVNSAQAYHSYLKDQGNNLRKTKFETLNQLNERLQTGYK